MGDFTLPKNSVYAGGTTSEDLATKTFQVGTAAGIRPGRAVRLDANRKLEVCPADSVSVLGFAGNMNWTNPEWKGDVDPAANDEIDVVLAQPGVWVRARAATDLSASGNVHLKTGANGTLVAFGVAAAADATQKVARLLKGADGSGGETDILAVIA